MFVPATMVTSFTGNNSPSQFMAVLSYRKGKSFMTWLYVVFDTMSASEELITSNSVEKV